MSSKDIQPLEEIADSASTEVQFALVIARLLETVTHDLQFRRQIVYDLARYKLLEQVKETGGENAEQMRAALETAIKGVEKFSREVPRIEPSSPKALDSPGPGSNIRLLAPADAAERIPTLISSENKRTGRHPLWSITARILAVLIFAGSIIVLATQRERLASLTRLTAAPPQEVVAQPPTPVESAPARNLPTDYGVYATVDDASLTDLPVSPVRPPDMRIAISPVFKRLEQPPLPSGRVKFIIFRRDAANVIPERIDVRVVAKIVRDFSNSAVNKPRDSDEAWVMRNISFPFRSSPVPEKPEMYEIHSEDPQLTLPAGNYVLALKTQAYQFRIAGNITDTNQCIERVASTAGTFFSPCKTPPP